MALQNYGIVDWIMDRLDFNFSDFADGETKDGIRQESLEAFFDKGIKIAQGKAETQQKASALDHLRSRSKFRDKLKGKIEKESAFDVGVEEKFERALKRMIPSELPDSYKDNLNKKIKDVSSKSEFRGMIEKEKNEYAEVQRQEKEKLEEERKEKEQAEEIRQKEMEIAQRETERFEREQEREREVKRQEMEIARKIAREQERLQSEDRRKRENAKRQLEKMRERGQLK